MKIRIARWPYNDNDRAQTERETRGHIKIITTAKGKIVGATIVGAQASELIGMWALAIAQGLNIRTFTEIVLPYPTLSELAKRAAIDYFTPRLTGGWVRRIIAMDANLRLRRIWKQPANQLQLTVRFGRRESRASVSPENCCC